LGRASAPARGRDPGGFPTDWDLGLLAPCHLPGILVEVMAGIALSFRLRDESRVALVVDDVAATGSGDWHEGLNFAAVREVPMVLVVDASRRRPVDAAADSMADRAPAYGFTAHTVAGTDPRAVEGIVWSAAEAARTGRGLQVVEVTAAQEDPVEWLLRTLVTSEALTAEAAAERVRGAEEEMSRALAEVEAEPEPDPAVALDPVRPSSAPWSPPCP
ncbi:MAG TPA: thiamine pyrophosphate-dependent enzyme, partial [Longimicrobiales bacterium]|nr:thiamine pyrophosphate-dependent enzyme [Longimicrobiales bacterium]